MKTVKGKVTKFNNPISKEQIIASSKDAEIFFEAIAHPIKPNNDLLLAAQEYKALYLAINRLTEL